MDRIFECLSCRQRNKSPVGEKCVVQRGERVLLDRGMLAQMFFEQGVIGSQSCRKTADVCALSGRKLRGEFFREVAIHKDEASGFDATKAEFLQIRFAKPIFRRIKNGTKGKLGDRRDVGETP